LLYLLLFAVDVAVNFADNLAIRENVNTSHADPTTFAVDLLSKIQTTDLKSEINASKI
jgi:hypothetical protein